MYQAISQRPQPRLPKALTRIDLRPVHEECWVYCHDLARANMSPYLQRQGMRWNSAAWYAKARISEFFLVESLGQRVGFASVRADPDNRALHLSDLQLEPHARNQGIGSACLERFAHMARHAGLHGLKLHVFADNPARRLYRRLGFRIIDRDFDKLTMMLELDAG